MKILNIVLVVLILIFSGCSFSTPKPVHPEDIPMKVVLKREDVKRLGENVASERGFDAAIDVAFSSEGFIILLPAAVVFSPIFIAGSHAIPNTDVYIWPEGREEYKTAIYWGENTIYVPQEYEGKKVVFHVEFVGKYKGKTTVTKIVKRKAEDEQPKN